MSIIGNTGISSPVADLGIDKRSGGEGGRRRTQTASYALEGPVGMLPPGNFFKSEASNEVFWIIFRPVFSYIFTTQKGTSYYLISLYIDVEFYKKN